MNKPKWIILHHEAAENGFESINRDHKDREYPKSELGFYAGYHYYFDEGSEIKARFHLEIGAHTIGMNSSSLGLCMKGNYSRDGKYPSDELKMALKKRIVYLMKKYNIPLKRVVPHRFFSRTECYGLNLKNDWVQNLVAKELEMGDNVEEKRRLLKKNISIIEQLIRLYILLKAELFK